MGPGAASTQSEASAPPVHVGVSVEGRKFWRFVPFGFDFPTLRREFLVGHTVAGGLFSEDLDDFIDGLAGGLAASILVHLKERVILRRAGRWSFRLWAKRSPEHCFLTRHVGASRPASKPPSRSDHPNEPFRITDMVTVKPYIAQIGAYAPPWLGLDRSHYLAWIRTKIRSPCRRSPSRPSSIISNASACRPP